MREVRAVTQRLINTGHELTGLALRDGCRFGGAGASCIEPGSTWQNPCVES